MVCCVGGRLVLGFIRKSPHQIHVLFQDLRKLKMKEQTTSSWNFCRFSDCNLPMAGRYFPRKVDEEDANGDKRNAQQLSHVEGHAFLKRHLLLFYEFNHEAGEETYGEARAQDPAGKLRNLGLPECGVETAECEQVGARLVEHCRMSGDIIDPKKYDGPGKLRRQANNFRVEKVSGTNEARG